MALVCTSSITRKTVILFLRTALHAGHLAGSVNEHSMLHLTSESWVQALCWIKGLLFKKKKKKSVKKGAALCDQEVKSGQFIQMMETLSVCKTTSHPVNGK